MRFLLLATTCLTPALLLGSLVSAGELPAVSSPNTVLSLGLSHTDAGVTGIEGSGALALPVYGLLGAQADGVFRYENSGIEGNAAAHLFLRDPAVGLIGLYANAGIDGAGAVTPRLGLEAELYSGPVALSGLLTSTAEGELEGQTRLSIYPSADSKLTVGLSFDPDQIARYSLGFEQKLGGNTSGFAELRYKNDQSFVAVGGVRLQLGVDDRSLIERDREDQAPVWGTGVSDNGTDLTSPSPTVSPSSSASSSTSPSTSTSTSPSTSTSTSPSTSTSTSPSTSTSTSTSTSPN